MNLDFTRYQPLPKVEVQALAAIAASVGDKGCPPGRCGALSPTDRAPSPGRSVLPQAKTADVLTVRVVVPAARGGPVAVQPRTVAPLTSSPR